MNMRDLPPDLEPVIPWSSEAESGVLGALLMDNDAWDKVADMLAESDFFSSANRLVFAAIGSMISANKPADVVTVFERLQSDGKADDAGGLVYLNALSQFTMSPAHVRRYAEIIAERSLMRRLMDAAGKVQTVATEAGLKATERLDKAQGYLQALQFSRSRAMPTGISDNVVGMLDRIQNLADGTTTPGIQTGIPGLDRMIGGGFKGGKQIIVAARPSIGKSSLAEQLCLNLALAGHPTAFFSMEMGKEELTDRAVANIGRIALDRITSGQLQDEEWSRLTEAVETMRNLPLYLDDQPALTLHDIAAKARMLKRNHDIKLIVVDYLQLCSGGKDKDNRHHQIEELSRGIKSLAKQLDLTFITLSQLNREVEKRTSGRPILSDLKESGAIEEDADIVMLLSRMGDAVNGFQTIHCDIPKNRQGKTGSIALGFDGAFQRWHETVMPAQPLKPARRHYTEEV
jgi:replicative DNA helicase